MTDSTSRELSLVGKRFLAQANTANGTIDTETEMHFTEDADIIRASYAGGSIVRGDVIALKEREFILAARSIGTPPSRGRMWRPPACRRRWRRCVGCSTRPTRSSLRPPAPGTCGRRLV